MKIMSATYSTLKILVNNIRALLNNIARFLLSGISAKRGDTERHVKYDFVCSRAPLKVGLGYFSEIPNHPGPMALPYIYSALKALLDNILTVLYTIRDIFYTLISKAAGCFSTLALDRKFSSVPLKVRCILDKDFATNFNLGSGAQNIFALKPFKISQARENIFNLKLFIQNEIDQNQNRGLNKNFFAEKFFGKLNTTKNIFAGKFLRNFQKLENVFNRKLFKQNETDQNQKNDLLKSVSAENNFAEDICAENNFIENIFMGKFLEMSVPKGDYHSFLNLKK